MLDAPWRDCAQGLRHIVDILLLFLYWVRHSELGWIGSHHEKGRLNQWSHDSEEPELMRRFTSLFDNDFTASSDGFFPPRLSVQMSVILSMRYLQTAVEGAMALENPEEDSEGYLLEKGVKETLEDLKAKALAMLKFGQVEPNADGEAPEDAEKGADNTEEKAASSAAS